MQRPRPTAGTDVHLSYGDYAEGTHEAWKEVGMPTSQGQSTVDANLADLVKHNAALRQAQATHDEAVRLTNKARAAFIVSDQSCDSKVMAVSDALLNGPAMRNRNDPIYVQVIGSSRATDVTESIRTEQPEVVDQLLLRLDATDDFEGKQAARDALAKALAHMKAKREALRSAQTAEETAFIQLQAARQALRDTLTRGYGGLTAAYPNKRDFVEGFYLRRSVKKGSNTEEVEEVGGGG